MCTHTARCPDSLSIFKVFVTLYTVTFLLKYKYYTNIQISRKIRNSMMIYLGNKSYFYLVLSHTT